LGSLFFTFVLPMYCTLTCVDKVVFRLHIIDSRNRYQSWHESFEETYRVSGGCRMQADIYMLVLHNLKCLNRRFLITPHGLAGFRVGAGGAFDSKAASRKFPQCFKIEHLTIYPFRHKI
ncbi:MAG: hypothetical protein Q4B32_07425, partial [Clostridia bacterium]|nr:hypothetical protein [Clostridia bacterium]